MDETEKFNKWRYVCTEAIKRYRFLKHKISRYRFEVYIDGTVLELPSLYLYYEYQESLSITYMRCLIRAGLCGRFKRYKVEDFFECYEPYDLDVEMYIEIEEKGYPELLRCRDIHELHKSLYRAKIPYYCKKERVLEIRKIIEDAHDKMETRLEPIIKDGLMDYNFKEVLEQELKDRDLKYKQELKDRDLKYKQEFARLNDKIAVLADMIDSK